jgi:hypothetical protein
MPRLPSRFAEVILTFATAVFPPELAATHQGARSGGALRQLPPRPQPRGLEPTGRIPPVAGPPLDAFVPSDPVLLGLDDTIERRRGKRIGAKCIYHDPVRSSHAQFVKASGLRWLGLMLPAPVPRAGRVWTLPPNTRPGKS